MGCPQHWGNLPFSRNTHGPRLQCFLKESGLYLQGWRWLSRIGEWFKGRWTGSPISPAAWPCADRLRVSADTAEQRLRLGRYFWTLIFPCFHLEFLCLSNSHRLQRGQRSVEPATCFVTHECCAARHAQLCLSLRPSGLSPTRPLCPWESPARTLEGVAMPSSRGSSRPRDQTCISCTGRRILLPPCHLGSPVTHEGPC